MVSLRKRFFVWWYRSGIGIRLVLFSLLLFLIYTLLYSETSLTEPNALPSNLAVFSLVNLNVAILCILVFLVGRNLAKILFDRKHKVLGSRLRSRLVAAFVGLTAIPAVLLVIVASGLLSRAIDGWFSSPAETSVEAAKEIGRIHFRERREHTLRVAKNISVELQSLQLEIAKPDDLGGFLEKERVSEGLYAIELLNGKWEQLAVAQNAAAHVDYFAIPQADSEDLKKALAGESFASNQETTSSQFIRAFSPLVLKGEELIVVVTYRVRSDLSEALSTIRQSYQEYLQLQHFRNPLRSTYILTLYILAGLVLFAAMWVGIFIAKQLTGPIQRLSEGMLEVARGNYGLQVHHSGGDEIAILTQNFNQMSIELRESVHQAEKRRLYLETVLSNLAVGVIVIDTEREVIGVNLAALKIMGKNESRDQFEGRPLKDCVPEELLTHLNALELQTEDKNEDESRSGEIQVEIVVKGRERKILCTAGKLSPRDGNESLGSVYLLDDVTALSEAQKLAAWREAARRIAHEIKNPLTPIKLAAQRLTRTFKGDDETGQLVTDATSTIIEHVDSIKRLADEFSRFARMPTAEFAPADLNTLIHEVVLSYVENESGITFQSIVDDKLPSVEIDVEQIRRLLINLIENSVNALKEELSSSSSDSQPRIIVRSRIEEGENKAVLEVCDNGPGIAPADKGRVFEPYFSRSSGGTGLGLAIVSAIVSEHGGDIEVEDHVPRGTKVVVSFPISAKEGTQRRFVLATG